MKNKKENSLEKKVKIALAENGVTQAELARKMGIPAPQLSHWLKGVYKPTSQNLQKLADALNRPINYFFDKSPIITGDNNNVNSRNSSDKDIIIMQQEIALMKKDIENINLRMQLLEDQKRKK